MKVKKMRVALFLLLAGLLVAFWPAQASVVKQMTMQELVQNSDLIIHGTVTNVQSAWNSDGTIILTKVTIGVSRKLKGAKTIGRTLQLIQLGGTLEGKSMSIVGEPRFTPSEEVILYLQVAKNNPEVNYWIVGMSQGKYNVVTNQATGAKEVFRDLGGVVLAKPGKGEINAQAEAPIPLNKFYQTIEELVGGAK